MDFERVIRLISEHLAGRQQPFAIIGGLALAAYGLPRTTLDLDLTVDASFQDHLVSFFESLGYQTLHRSSGYSNHLHQEEAMGRVDVVYLRGEASASILGTLQERPGPGDASMPVPRPEYLAALKAFAMRNDPSRRLRELADIRELLSLPGVDRAEVEGYLRSYGLEAALAALDS